MVTLVINRVFYALKLNVRFAVLLKNSFRLIYALICNCFISLFTAIFFSSTNVPQRDKRLPIRSPSLLILGFSWKQNASKGEVDINKPGAGELH